MSLLESTHVFQDIPVSVSVPCAADKMHAGHPVQLLIPFFRNAKRNSFANYSDKPS